MTIEETKEVAGEVAGEETKQEAQEQPEVTNVSEVNKETETISFDLWGESIELPVEKAKALIEKRQAKTAEFKELQEKLNSFQSEKQQLADKLKVETLAKENKLKELENHFTEQLNEKVSKYKTKIVESELTRNLLSHPEFLGQDVLTDAIKLLKADNNFDLDETDNITASGKTITQVVSDFISERPAFRKVNKAAHSGARPAAIQAPKTTNPMGSLTSGLGKLLN